MQALGFPNRGALLVEVIFVCGVRRGTRFFGDFVATSDQTLKI